MPSVELPELVDARSPEANQIEKQRARQLTRALQLIAPREREVLLLSYFEDLRHREIAQLTDSTPGAVKVQVHRARRALREQLEALEQKR
jgi:RNA polymerase sigma-70 factor (ECF subfamily)